MTESLIGAGASLHKAINSAVVVQPAETPFHLPALARVAGLAAFRGEDGCMIVLSPRDTRMDVSDKKELTQCIAVIPFVRADPLRKPYVNAVNGAECERLVMAVCSRADKRQEVSSRINDNTPFQPIGTMFSRVSAVFLAPFFDFTTDASRYPLRQ